MFCSAVQQIFGSNEGWVSQLKIFVSDFHSCKNNGLQQTKIIDKIEA